MAARRANPRLATAVAQLKVPIAPDASVLQYIAIYRATCGRYIMGNGKESGRCNLGLGV